MIKCVTLRYRQVLAVLLLSVIPWPGPSVFKISCPRDRASVVRRIVHKVRKHNRPWLYKVVEIRMRFNETLSSVNTGFQRWIPILKKYQVELPLECPFHESRDIFRPQQKAKHQHRPSQWTCGLCGKSFYAEKHLDAHFDNRHKSNVNTVNQSLKVQDFYTFEHCRPRTRLKTSPPSFPIAEKRLMFSSNKLETRCVLPRDAPIAL